MKIKSNNYLMQLLLPHGVPHGDHSQKCCSKIQRSSLRIKFGVSKEKNETT